MKEIYQGLLKTILAQRANGTRIEKFRAEDEGSEIESINDLS